MAHFAKLDENNNVLAVHVVNNNVITIDGNESEQVGVDFLIGLYGHTLWKQTSYNGTIRKNYAGIGYTYDAARDAFIAPKPFNSWILNDTTCQWQAPTPLPTPETGDWIWDEETVTWIVGPKPFNSWVLDEATCRWQAPTPMPTTEGKFYYWSEDDLSWREITND